MQRFSISVPEHVLDDLRERLSHIRWPADIANDDWAYGVNRAYLEELVSYWRHKFDWRVQEAQMNVYEHYRATIDDVPIHFMYARGKGSSRRPLIMTHGWPWTFWDYYKVVPRLTDPAAFGGDAADAFDVIVPSLPGYGFSTPLGKPGVDFTTTADIWVKLMRDTLGFDKFVAYGSDWGTFVTTQLGHKYPQFLAGIHLSLMMPMDFLTEGKLPPESDYDPDELQSFLQTISTAKSRSAHLAVNSNEPQTISYALHDSPVGLCAWLLQRRKSWSDNNGNVESVFSKDELLTNVMLYWVTESYVSSARLYYEAAHRPWRPAHLAMPAVTVPTGVTIGAKEVYIAPKKWAQKYYNLSSLKIIPGGHYLPMESPEGVATGIQEFCRTLDPRRWGDNSRSCLM